MERNAGALNIREAAAFLGVHEQTVRKLARSGKIPAFKVGRDWRFSGEALTAWASDQQLPGSDGVGCSVLVVDDDELVCKFLERILTRLGCRVSCVTEGPAGLDLVRDNVPDLILLDLVMPDMNGPQFLEQLRKRHPTLPVVIVTGYPEGDLMQQAMDHAPISLLSKPVDHGLLENTVRTLVGKMLHKTGGR